MIDHTQYRARLQTLLDDITKELQSVGIHNPENPSDWIAVPNALDAEEPDSNLAADNVEEWNERRALVATLETRYNNITQALKNIENDSYGKCEVCQADIEEKRLDVNPAAQTCLTHLEEGSRS